MLFFKPTKSNHDDNIYIKLLTVNDIKNLKNVDAQDKNNYLICKAVVDVDGNPFFKNYDEINETIPWKLYEKLLNEITDVNITTDNNNTDNEDNEDEKTE
jgi:hypothetical protein